jgi:hypothetical protein
MIALRHRPQASRLSAERMVAGRLCRALNLAFGWKGAEAELTPDGYTGRVILSPSAVERVLSDRAQIAAQRLGSLREARASMDRIGVPDPLERTLGDERR